MAKKETKRQEQELRVLKCVMRKEYALEILAGTKKHEFRAWSDFWAVRLCEFNDPDNPHQATDLKEYDVIHFYPYNNKWFLDCEVKTIELWFVDDEFRKEFPSEADAPEGMPLFVITLGKVLATNLK
ncbi:MAG: hypothetical protein LUC49_04235 [Prevotella sp.]|nr:hypothetical protein [Prevotella sp.]